jgi:hypothetical protein
VLLAALAAFMTALDTLVVTTALPVLWVQLHAGLSGLEWTVNPYNLAFACCLLTGAALGDRFGRRRTLGTGLAHSTAASAACALSSGVENSETGVLAGDANGPTEREDSLARAPGLVADLISSAASKQERRRGLGASVTTRTNGRPTSFPPRRGTSRRRARSPESRGDGARRAAHQRPVAGHADDGSLRSPALAEITGAGRAWTVSMISELSMPCR